MWIDWSPRQSKSLPWVMVMEIMSQPCAFMGHGFHSKLLSCRRVWMEIILYDNVQQVFSTCWNRSWILNISEPPHEKWFRVPWSTNIMFFVVQTILDPFVEPCRSAGPGHCLRPAVHQTCGLSQLATFSGNPPEDPNDSRKNPGLYNHGLWWVKWTIWLSGKCCKML